MFYAISADEAKWESKINSFIALAPVTRIDHTKSALFKYMAKTLPVVQATLNLGGVYHILDGLQTEATKITCYLVPDLCQLIEGFLITTDPSLDDSDRFQVYMGHFPAGASTQSIYHYAQNINSG